MTGLNEFFDNLVTICLGILLLFITIGILFIIIRQVIKKIKSIRRRKNRRKRRREHNRKKDIQD